MKKVVKLVAVLCLLVVAYVGMPVQSSAETNQSEAEVEIAASKPVTIHIYVGPNEPIQSIYEYNVGGWSGPLYYAGQQSFGDTIRVTYSGTVYCSGPCAMAKDNTEE